MKNPREIAFLALIYFKDEGFVESFFEKNEFSLSDKDLKLAKQIAYGTVKRLLSLKHLSEQLATIKLKSKEKLLLYSALYQHFFMDKIPLFAIVNETTSLVKKYFKKDKVGFFNAILRKLEKVNLMLTQGEDVGALSIFYSYPEFFIKELLLEYGLEATKKILEAQNLFSPPTARIRREEHSQELIHDKKFKMIKIKEGQFKALDKNKNVYVQNITQVKLLEALLEVLKFYPKKILDLCAAPGGKVLALYDLFPEAEFFLNDISAKRIKVLKRNLLKYEIKKAKIFNLPAQDFISTEKYDLIIIDAPCSNSGVLSKRAEARWRLNKEALKQLQRMQVEILNQAFSLLAAGGQIWYLTCSILKEENEAVISQVLENQKAKMINFLKILPDLGNSDGGFAASLKKDF